MTDARGARYHLNPLAVNSRALYGNMHGAMDDREYTRLCAQRDVMRRSQTPPLPLPATSAPRRHDDHVAHNDVSVRCNGRVPRARRRSLQSDLADLRRRNRSQERELRRR